LNLGLEDKEFAEILSEAIQQDQSGQRITWEDAKKQLGMNKIND
jgi:hypothetical protein